MHGGIEVDSEYGKGSVFTVRIPQQAISSAPMGEFLATGRRPEAAADGHGWPISREPTL